MSVNLSIRRAMSRNLQHSIVLFSAFVLLFVTISH